jgi:4-hydroxy-2-oxoglutarate aldolase
LRGHGKAGEDCSRHASFIFHVWGSADFTLQALIVGGAGIIAGTANLAPKACVRILNLYTQGNLQEAKTLQGIVARGDWAAIRGGFVAVKDALEAFEGYGGRPRRPCASSGGTEIAALKEELAELVSLEREL